MTVAFGNALFLTNVGIEAVEPTGTTVGTGTAATTRVFARIAGAAAAAGNALLYDVSIPANSSASFTFGITLAATDVITVQTGTANALTFTAFGTELA